MQSLHDTQAGEKMPHGHADEVTSGDREAPHARPLVLQRQELDADIESPSGIDPSDFYPPRDPPVAAVICTVVSAIAVPVPSTTWNRSSWGRNSVR